ICTNPTTPPVGLLANKFFEGIPVRANDFSQSCIEGPRISPSINASPGHRVHPVICPQPEQVGKSRIRISRTSFIFSECCQISKNRCVRTFPVGKGNCTQG